MKARLEQQIWERKDVVGIVQDATECQHPELKCGEGSGQSVAFANGNHVSEDNKPRCFWLTSSHLFVSAC